MARNREILQAVLVMKKSLLSLLTISLLLGAGHGMREGGSFDLSPTLRSSSHLVSHTSHCVMHGICKHRMVRLALATERYRLLIEGESVGGMKI